MQYALIFYDLQPILARMPPLQPIFINDNAPDVVDITVIGSQKRYLRTNEGVNALDESLFSRRR